MEGGEVAGGGPGRSMRPTAAARLDSLRPFRRGGMRGASVLTERTESDNAMRFDSLVPFPCGRMRGPMRMHDRNTNPTDAMRIHDRNTNPHARYEPVAAFLRGRKRGGSMMYAALRHGAPIP